MTTKNLPAPIPESVPEVCRNVPFMTSLEIADMTGIRHGNVMRDIDRELAKIGEPQLRFETGYLDAQGQRRRCYALPGEYLLFIASAYDAKLRMQIIRHWSALNNGTAQPVKDAANLFVGRLPLSGDIGAGLRAVVTDHQWRKLYALGVRGAWFLNFNGDRKPYVRATVAGKLTTLARLLTDAGRGEVVGYRNDDPLDLRTENLEVRRIKRKGAAQESPANTRGLVVDPLNGAR